MMQMKTLTKFFPGAKAAAVDALNLEVNDGEIVGFAGLNGAGKTTTIRICAGIIFPTSGTAEIDGHNIVSEKRKASCNIGWVPEFPNFEPNAKPVSLLNYYGRFYDINKKDLEDRIETLLKATGLSEHTEKRLKNYSQGMKKRFSLASALLSDPRNMLLDETLNGLDPEGVRYVKSLIMSMKKEGRAIFLSSHILSELENVADRIAIIKSGKVVSIVSRNELSHLGSRQTIRLSVVNPDSKLITLLQSYGEVSSEGNDFSVTNVRVDAEKAHLVNNELARAGYVVSRFTVAGENFEDYFFRLVGQ
ncbi:MAG: ABC transporter ATP-binding protein [Thermoplasmata archaeon]|nr:ABC transporter ATP-binding protein [Candidatus Sysuiplasma acidicola]MBX8646691.1 ABC transporter ATP-binding protein [Candidatus Sysuiplasma acidicola]